MTEPAPNREELYLKVSKESESAEILRILASDVSGGRANDDVLYRYLVECGFGSSRQDLQAVLEMLERSGLVRSRPVENFVVVELTDRGERVAAGREIAEGVARPPRG